jgi:hypothetical protein
MALRRRNPRDQAKSLPPRPSRLLRSYLRAAQAYMLISMPTCTSTIFGVFQVISVLLSQHITIVNVPVHIVEIMGP